MAPKGWATDEQTTFLESWIERYIDYQAKKDLNAMWPLVHEQWFKKWPIQDMSLDPSLLSEEEKAAVGTAIEARREVRLNSNYVLGLFLIPGTATQKLVS